MAIDKEIIQILSDFNEQLVKDTRISLQKKLDAKASEYKSRKVQSRLFASVNAPPAEYKGGGIYSKLVMNDYWGAINDGRSPTVKSGDGSLKKNLIKWIKSRQIKVVISKRKEAKLESLKTKGKLGKKIKKAYKQQTLEQAIEAAAYGMAQKIHKDGYEGNHFFDEVIKDGRLDKLKEDIAKVVKTEIIVDVQQASK